MSQKLAAGTAQRCLQLSAPLSRRNSPFECAPGARRTRPLICHPVMFTVDVLRGSLPLAARDHPFPHRLPRGSRIRFSLTRLPALPAQRAQLLPTVLPQAMTLSIPGMWSFASFYVRFCLFMRFPCLATSAHDYQYKGKRTMDRLEIATKRSVLWQLG